MSSSTFVKSTLILTVATLLSKVLGSIFRIPLQNIAGDAVLGIFALVYPVYMVALYLSVAGIPIAISKLIAEANANNEPHKVTHIYRTASFLAIAFGVLSFSILVGFSVPISEALGGPSTRIALIVVAGTLLVAPYMAVYRGFFQGYSNMGPTAVSQVIEQLVRVVLILAAAFVLVKLDYSDELVAGGVMVGSVVGALASLVYLRLKYQRFDRKITSREKYTWHDFSTWSRTILKISLPIAIGSVTMALFNFVDSFTVTYGLRNAGVTKDEITGLFGIYSRGLTLVQIVTIFASSIILPLVPLITAKLAERKFDETRHIIERTHRMTHLVSWPAAIGLFSLTIPVNIALFTNTDGSLMLAVINLSAVFTSLTILGTGVLQGLNAARIGAYIIVCGVGLKIVANILLIEQFGLDGAAYSTLLVYAVLFIVNSVFIYRRISYTIVGADTVKMILSALVMGAVIGVPTLYLGVTEWSRIASMGYVVLSMAVGGAIYFTLLLLSKAISKEDLQSLPIIGKRLERKFNFMFKQKWLWGIIILLLVVSSPGLINRWQAEKANDEYEMIIPYEEIWEVARSSEQTVDELLSTLQDSGLRKVSVEPLTFENLEERNLITIYEEHEIADLLRFTSNKDEIDPNKSGYYMSIVEQEDSLLPALFTEQVGLEEVSIAGEPFYFLSNGDKLFDLETPIGYDTQAIETLEEHGLQHVLRVENAELEEVNNRIYKQLLELKGEEAVGLLGSGEEAFGFGQEARGVWIESLRDAGYFFYTIEGNRMKGEYENAKQANYETVRLLSINKNRETNLTLETSIDRTIRAVKERNIRSIFYHLKTTGDTEENIKEATSYLTLVQERMPAHYKAGSAQVFDDVTVPSWVTALILLAGVIFVYAVFELVKWQPLRIAAALFMAALSLAYFALDRVLFLQAFALIISVLTPIYAVVKAAHGSTRIRDIAMQYVKAVGISLVGITIIIGLLNGNGFITGFEMFRGVKLVYIIPIFGLFIFALLEMNDLSKVGLKKSLTKSVTLLNKDVKYWHIVLLVVVAAFGLFYISRTGNSGSVSSFELAFRQWLEETLYVRPRTKEFLIGFPFFVLALYVMGICRRWGSVLLVVGVIGFLSIVNTFTHLHIPVDVSLLRTAYSVVLGFIIGLVFIAVFKVGMALWKKAKVRWL